MSKQSSIEDFKQSLRVTTEPKGLDVETTVDIVLNETTDCRLWLDNREGADPFVIATACSRQMTSHIQLMNSKGIGWNVNNPTPYMKDVCEWAARNMVGIVAIQMTFRVAPNLKVGHKVYAEGVLKRR